MAQVSARPLSRSQTGMGSASRMARKSAVAVGDGCGSSSHTAAMPPTARPRATSLRPWASCTGKLEGQRRGRTDRPAPWTGPARPAPLRQDSAVPRRRHRRRARSRRGPTPPAPRGPRPAARRARPAPPWCWRRRLRSERRRRRAVRCSASAQRPAAIASATAPQARAERTNSIAVLEAGHRASGIAAKAGAGGKANSRAASRPQSLLAR